MALCMGPIPSGQDLCPEKLVKTKLKTYLKLFNFSLNLFLVKRVYNLVVHTACAVLASCKLGRPIFLFIYESIYRSVSALMSSNV